jgi:6-pyruvoyltetrahydropterin/6-carboxytetrahydropterin synthase
MFHLTVERTICTAHSGLGERGLHGHNWRVRATVSASDLNDRGQVVSPTSLQSLLWEVLEPLDHRRLEDLPLFSERPSTAMGVAKYVGESLQARIAGAQAEVTRVEVADGTAVTSCWTP